MRHLVDRLQEFVADAKALPKPVELSQQDERIFRSLKTTGERATKGRLISKCVFEAKDRHGISLMMVMEGRHSMSVAKQVARRFDDSDELEFANVVQTKSGAIVVLRPKNTDKQ